MKDLMNEIVNALKKQSQNRLNNIYKVCSSASGELDDYCRIDGYRDR